MCPAAGRDHIWIIFKTYRSQITGRGADLHVVAEGRERTQREAKTEKLLTWQAECCEGQRWLFPLSFMHWSRRSCRKGFSSRSLVCYFPRPDWLLFSPTFWLDNAKNSVCTDSIIAVVYILIRVCVEHLHFCFGSAIVFLALTFLICCCLHHFFYFLHPLCFSWYVLFAAAWYSRWWMRSSGRDRAEDHSCTGAFKG